MTDPNLPHAQEKRFTWLQSRLFPRGLHLLTWASYSVILFVLIEYILNIGTPQDSRYYTAIIALCLLLVINALWEDIKTLFRSEETGDWAFLFASAGLAILTTWAGQTFSSIYVIMMIAAQANSTKKIVPALVFTFVLAVCWLSIFVLMGVSTQTFVSIFAGLFIGLTFVITLSQVVFRFSEQTTRANHLLEQLQAANAELVEARQREKELIIAEERVRVARDLHDGLGHHLTALSIQLQAVEKLVKENPELAAEAAHNARSEVQAALKEVRQSVATLREAPVDIQNLPQVIARLVDEAAKRSGLQASFKQQGQCTQLSAAAAMTLYRAAQEGLTNVQKHSRGATQVDVHLAYSLSSIRLSIHDNGKTPPELLQAPAFGPTGSGLTGTAPLTGSGFGLAGLRERALLLGGTLSYGPSLQGGFLIELAIPLSPTSGEQA